MDGHMDNGPYLDSQPGKPLLTTDPLSDKPNGCPSSSNSEPYLTGMTYPDVPGPHFTTPASPAVQRLPEDLFIDIVQLYVDPEAPIRDLIRVILVCKRWRTTVEGTPFFWCRITGSETLGCIRKGLEMSRESQLDIEYDGSVSEIDAWTFLGEIGPHIARWKSLDAVFINPNFYLGELETKPAPALERLRLVNGNWRRWKNPLKLFGGAPAPPTLKDVQILRIPVALHPLRLGQMRRFKLATHPLATTAEIARALQGSPDLYKVELTNIGDQNRNDLTLVEGTIRLPLLNYLRIYKIPQHMVQQILSNISAPSLRTLRVKLLNPENPSIRILPALAPLIPAMKSIASDALAIDVNFTGPSYEICIGELSLSFQSDADGWDAGELAMELFDWLDSQLGGHLMDHPVTVSLENCPTSSLCPDWLSSRVKVTKLRLWYELLESEHSFDDAFPSLSDPNALSSTGWLLPHVEILETNLTWVGGNSDLIDMISARQSAANHSSQLEGRTTTMPPRSLREIRLSYGGREVSGKHPPDIEFMRAVQNAAVDADVYWSSVKWEE